MTRFPTTLFAATVILGSVVAAKTVLADETSPPSQPSHMAKGSGGHHGMMMGQMAPETAEQMAQMVERCNRMMEDMGNSSTEPEQGGTRHPHE